MISMSKTRMISSAAALAAVLSTGGVHADTIGIQTFSGAPPGPPDGAAYQLECTSTDCDIHGITASEDPPTSQGNVNDNTSTAFFGVNANPADEADALATLLGIDQSLVVAGDTTENPGSDTTFSSDALWFSVKQGLWTAFFRNNSGGTLELSFERDLDQGAGFEGVEYSNVTEFSVVPIPAAAWLFGSALVGMAGVGYRRSRKQTA
jgi:hypothetical protein